METEYGLMYGRAAASRVRARSTGRTTQYLMPGLYDLPGRPRRRRCRLHIWVPIDNEHTLVWGIRWNPTREIQESWLDDRFGDDRRGP